MDLHDQYHRSRKRRARGIWIAVLAVLALLVVSVFLFRKPVFTAYAKAVSGRANFLAAQTAIQDQKFDDANERLGQAVEDFRSASESMASLRPLKLIPGVGRQVSAVENLFQVGIQTGKAAQTLTSVAQRIAEPLQKDGEVTFASIKREEKRQILQLVTESEPDLQGAKADIDLAALYLEKVPERGLLPPIAQAIAPLRNELPKIQTSLAQALPAVRVLPGFVGYPEQRTYLFLLQNNGELRPTGGFIGTYGMMTMRDGEVVSLQTDNIYNLDAKAEAFLNIEAPKPLQKYLDAKRWFMRDSNWSPDFPTSAKEVLRFYDLEKQAKQNLDGIIAITPTFIESLMELTGSITVDGVTFTHENVVDQLQYQVEVAFLRKGLTDAERKDIIGDLSQILFQRLLTLPREQWGKLAALFQQMTAEKHFLLFLNSEEEQTLVRDQGWGGELKSFDTDGFLVVDANLASLKTDQVMDRSIEYSVRKDGNDLIATLSVTYDHKGGFDWKTTRYRTYTRIHVPKGSELVESSGFLENDKLHGAKPGTVETWEELGNTVFGGFTSIEPKERGTISVTYRLPTTIREAFERGQYKLTALKQPGTRGHLLRLDIQPDGRLQSYSPAESATVADGHIRFETDLRQDRTVSLDFSP